jgi:DNA transformation protein
MALSAGFVESMKDLLAPMGAISVRRMFGGAAVYCDGQVFALISDDVLYLKVDDTSRGAFTAEACGPFEYATRDGTQVLNTYHRAPDRLLDDPEDMIAWARIAVAVGRRAALGKKPARASATPAGRRPKAGKARR